MWRTICHNGHRPSTSFRHPPEISIVDIHATQFPDTGHRTISINIFLLLLGARALGEKLKFCTAKADLSHGSTVSHQTYLALTLADLFFAENY